MSSTLFVATLGTASAALLRVSNGTVVQSVDKPNFGNGQCQCVGFDNVEGTTDIDGIHYPADFGARCEAWDDGISKGCTGANPPSWCKKSWCYVDPCKCDLPDVPKISSYMPDAQYQGKTLYYSYETCGSSDEYTADHHKEACVNQKSADACGAKDKCKWDSEMKKCGGNEIMEYCQKPLVVVKHGHRNCKCIGIDGQKGTMVADIGGGKKLTYPADVGAVCNNWEMDRHPECKGDEKEGWCHDRWCFVDPCDCDTEHVAKASSFYKDSTFQGKPIFYSYLTCGSEDRYSAKHRSKAQKRQGEACSAAWALTPVFALLVSLLRM